MLELLEDRTVLNSYTVGDVAHLVAAISDSNTHPGANTITLARCRTFTLEAANNTTNGGNGLPVTLAGNNLTIKGNGDTIRGPPTRVQDFASSMSPAGHH